MTGERKNLDHLGDTLDLHIANFDTRRWRVELHSATYENRPGMDDPPQHMDIRWSIRRRSVNPRLPDDAEIRLVRIVRLPFHAQRDIIVWRTTLSTLHPSQATE